MEIIRYARKNNGLRFALWENVPGSFSSNKGADFSAVVEQMAGLENIGVPENGWGKEGAAVGSNGLLEWSVLDAQFFGLAQRRKRVFALLDFGDWESRRPVLLEPEGLRGDTSPSRETGQSATADVGASATKRGFDKQRIGQYADNNVASTCAARDYKDATDLVVEKAVYSFDSLSSNSMKSKNPHSGCRQVELAKYLDTSNGCPSKNQGGIAVVSLNSKQMGLDASETLASTLCANDYKEPQAVAIAGNIIGRRHDTGGNGQGFDDTGSCYTLTAMDRHAVAYSWNGDTTPKNSEELSLILRASQGGEGLGVAYSIVADTTPKIGEEINGTLRSQGGGGIVPPSVAYGITSKGNGDVFESQELHTALSTGGGQAGQGYPCARIESIVRRLTPIECERLQGFPDDFTKIPYRNKSAEGCPKGPRYKALGNSMAVPVMAWIGRKIEEAANGDISQG